jgi:hypothetical protein
VALLVTVNPPVTAVAPPGVNVTFTVADCPGVSTVPTGKPVALKPAPETLTFETVTFELPVLEIEIDCEEVLPTFTLPKARLAGLAASTPGFAAG